MARYYDLIWDFDPNADGKVPTSPDCISVTSVAIMACWRYRFPVTFSRSKLSSFSTNPDDATRLRDSVLVIVEDIANLQVNSTKSNHVSQLSATLLPGANYLTEIFPGDWIAAWIVNDVKTAESLVKRIRAGEACNGWNDGFKFLGRTAGGPRVSLSQDPNGTKRASYSISAAGFTEFDASVYYEPHFAGTSTGVAATDWLRFTGKALNDLVVVGENGKDPLISVNKAIPFFISVFYGEGVPKNQGAADQPGEITRGLDNPNSFVIPDPIASLLGVTQGTKSNGKKGWNDICNVIHGVQTYQLSNQGVAFSDSPGGAKMVNQVSAGQIFAPDGLPLDGTVRRMKCPQDMLGMFLPSPPQFSGNVTVWSILEQYLNKSVNEMYTCLRAGPNGAVMPTLVARQLPFTSGVLDDTYKPHPVKELAPPPSKPTKAKTPPVDPESNPINAARHLALTKFGEVPRWGIHPALFFNANLGRSDSVRFNFIHVYGEAGQPNINMTNLIVRDPPIADDLDIGRSGLRPYISTVNCAPQDVENRRSGDWMYILSDILMGLHLTLSGSIELIGIQSPICIGDNVEFDQQILHIESVSHSFSKNTQNGKTAFRTNLAVSHGMTMEQLTGGDFALYSGTSPDDLRGYAPATSRDYMINVTEPSDPPSPGIATPIPPTPRSADRYLNVT
jgi:hypothetical protein